jgi:mannose-6-phosphate isomerase
LLADGGLRDVVTAVLTLPADQQRDLIDSVLSACSAAAAAGGQWAAECGWAARIAELFPGDSGIVLALLMNLVRLRPSQAVFLSAGRVHAYLRGAGVELMAASDNVLRSGLTVKHVDVAELLSVLDFTEEVVEPLEPVPDGPLLRYPVPVPDFSLATAELDGTAELTLTAPGPQILLVTRGEITLRVFDGRDESVSQGHAVFIAAGTSVSARGTGQLFQGTTGGLGEI